MDRRVKAVLKGRNKQYLVPVNWIYSFWNKHSLFYPYMKKALTLMDNDEPDLKKAGQYHCSEIVQSLYN